MTQRYSREDIARRAAADIPAGSYVNLGIGLPVRALDYWTPAHGVIVHSENGILGMRARSDADPVDPDLTNAAKQNVAMAAGGSFFNHADSFAMMRGATWTIASWAPTRSRRPATWPTGRWDSPASPRRWAAPWTWPWGPSGSTC